MARSAGVWPFANDGKEVIVDNDSKNQLADLVQDATAETVQSFTCPTCGGSLTIQFVPKVPPGKRAGSLHVTCAHCVWRVISDGLRYAPAWVQELGPKVQTAQKQVG